MGVWKVFVRILGDENYQILGSPDYPGIYSRQAQLNVTGTHKPDIPSGTLTKAQYLRWKADLIAIKGMTFLMLSVFEQVT